MLALVEEAMRSSIQPASDLRVDDQLPQREGGSIPLRKSAISGSTSMN